MQKDVHFNLTYSLARRAGISKINAKKIAWANQFTDELTDADPFEVQTQVETSGDWYDMKTQYGVLIPFHFIPGDDVQNWQWMTTENNTRSREFVNDAISDKDAFQFGIALHSFQDTFSHQGFSGWREDRNSCYEWYHMSSVAPNVGHAEMRCIPDEVDKIWKDPRTDKKIDNKKRVLRAARETYYFLLKWQNVSNMREEWMRIKPEIQSAVTNKNYDKRKQQFNAISGDNIRYSKITNNMENKYRSDFISSATKHLALAIKSFETLPWCAPAV
jgi:hypothetical protein